MRNKIQRNKKRLLTPRGAVGDVSFLKHSYVNGRWIMLDNNLLSIIISYEKKYIPFLLFIVISSIDHASTKKLFNIWSYKHAFIIDILTCSCRLKGKNKMYVKIS